MLPINPLFILAGFVAIAAYLGYSKKEAKEEKPTNNEEKVEKNVEKVEKTS